MCRHDQNSHVIYDRHSAASFDHLVGECEQVAVFNAKVGIYANSIVLNQEGFSITGSSGIINSFGSNNIENNAGASTGTLTPVTGQ